MNTQNQSLDLAIRLAVAASSSLAIASDAMESALALNVCPGADLSAFERAIERAAELAAAASRISACAHDAAFEAVDVGIGARAAARAAL